MNMFVPTDMFTGLYNLSNQVTSIKEIEQNNTVADESEEWSLQ